MGGGGGNDPKEQESKMALAEQAAISLQRYGDTFVPLENMYIQDTLNQFGNDAYVDSMGRASTGTSAIYEEGLGELNRGAFARGVDPSSGAYQSESGSLRDAQARGMGLNAASTGIANTDQAYKGLGNVVRMGQGLATEAMDGNINRMNNQMDVANATAKRDFARSSSIQNMAGTGVGIAAGYGLNKGAV